MVRYPDKLAHGAKRPPAFFKHFFFWLALALAFLTLFFGVQWHQAKQTSEHIQSRLNYYGMYYDPEQRDIYYYKIDDSMLSIEERLDEQSFELLGQLLESPGKITPEDAKRLSEGIRQARLDYLANLKVYVSELAQGDRWPEESRREAEQRIAEEMIRVDEQVKALSDYYSQQTTTFTEAQEEEVQTIIYNLIIADSVIFDYPSQK